MRTLAVVLLALSPVLYAADTDGEVVVPSDEPETISEKLAAISMDMYSLHDDLRDERHDKNVQSKSEAVIKALQKIIDDAEDGDGSKKSQSGGDGKDGMKDSKITDYDGRRARVKLSPREWSRDFREDNVNTHMDQAKPLVGAWENVRDERWRLRLRAYFTSIAAAQADAEREKWATKK